MEDMFLGAGVMKRGLKYFGYEFGVDPFPTTQNFAKIGTEGGTILEAKVKELCDTHDAIEVENILCGTMWRPSAARSRVRRGFRPAAIRYSAL